MDLLNGEPIIELSGDEFLPIVGKTFVQQVEVFFQNQGGVAHSAFGDVILDKKGIKNDFHHGMSSIKRASFAAIKDVLESGIIVLPLDFYHTKNKKQLTGMIAAPIKIDVERYACIVEVIANKCTQRLYLHEAFLIKNLQEIVATSPVHDNNIITSRQPQGEVAKVLQNYICTNKNLNENLHVDVDDSNAVHSKKNKSSGTAGKPQDTGGANSKTLTVFGQPVRRKNYNTVGVGCQSSKTEHKINKN